MVSIKQGEMIWFEAFSMLIGDAGSKLKGAINKDSNKTNLILIISSDPWQFPKLHLYGADFRRAAVRAPPRGMSLSGLEVYIRKGDPRGTPKAWQQSVS